jgi:hypothetical protein
MANKKTFVSFDYENDRRYYNLLEAWNSNTEIDFHITDCTPSEIQSASVSVVKQVLSAKIGEANYMIAIIGEHANSRHKDAGMIGYRNWQAYEIAKNAEKGNKLIIVKLNPSYSVPDEAYGQNAKWINSFNMPDIPLLKRNRV